MCDYPCNFRSISVISFLQFGRQHINGVIAQFHVSIVGPYTIKLCQKLQKTGMKSSTTSSLKGKLALQASRTTLVALVLSHPQLTWPSLKTALPIASRQVNAGLVLLNALYQGERISKKLFLQCQSTNKGKIYFQNQLSICITVSHYIII